MNVSLLHQFAVVTWCNNRNRSYMQNVIGLGYTYQMKLIRAHTEWMRKFYHTCKLKQTVEICIKS